MKRKYVVSTHLGDFTTWATSPKKAISNVRYRLFGCGYHERYTDNWTVKEAA